MKKIINIFLIACCIFPIFAANNTIQNSDDAGAGVDRYAVYIGSNRGGKGRDQLLYAGSDAKNFQKIMSEIGGVQNSNSWILIDPTKEKIDETLSAISEKINNNQTNAKRSEFIFYYSGHSDENSLLLGDTPYDYSILKAAITDVPSDIHIVILDSCYSGNFIRTKGGQKRKPFLMDDSSVVKGHAYLSSSSDNEYSQESDEIESSFFTNAMITGLRGAADTSGDNKVTLNELYSYAFNDTLSKTESSKAGPQHPNYNITLVGSGDLILSDLSSAEAMLSLSKEAKGRFIIRDAQGKLISEVNKTEEQPIFMALPAGQYSAVIIDEYSTKQGTFILEKDQIYVLDKNSLSSIKRRDTRLRGTIEEKADPEDLENDEILPIDDLKKSNRSRRRYQSAEVSAATESANEDESLPDLEDDEEEDFVFPPFNIAKTDFFHFALVPGFTFLSITGQNDTTFFSTGIIGSLEDNVMGFQISNIMNISAGYVFGMQNAGILNIAQDVLGAQAAGLFNISKSVSGAQVSGLFNIAHGKVYGGQISGLFNTASSSVSGIQISGLFNNSPRTVYGAQISGLANFGQSIEGIQASGLLNVARNVKGMQLGLINIAENNDGIALGLFNFIKNGVHDFGICWNTNDMVDLFYQSGTNTLFFTLGAEGYRQGIFNRGDASIVERRTGIVYAGIGSRLLVPYVSFDFEFLWKTFIANYISEIGKTVRTSDFVIENIPSFRLTVNLSPSSHVTFFGGASADLNIHNYNDQAFQCLISNINLNVNNDLSVKPAFFFGLKIK